MNWCRDLVYCDALLHTDPNLYCTQQDTGLQYYSIILYYTVSVLGRDEGYTAKYGLNPREFPRAQPEGTPEGSGHISPYIPSQVLIRTFYHF